jgi:hypothetical protein
MTLMRSAWVLVILFGAGSPVFSADEGIARPIALLKSVGREGKNNDSAGLAWKALVSQGATALFPTLEAIDDANPIASNWLRTAAGAIAENEVKAKHSLPGDQLDAFIKNVKFAPSARVIAYELLAAQDKPAAERLLPGFLNDPSADLRFMAVAAEFAKLTKSPTPALKADLEKLLSFAREQSQVEAIVKKLEKDFNTKVSLAEHFGFITQWDIAGPFESAQGKALKIKHRPEEKVIFEEKLAGKDAAEVKWKRFATRDPHGVVDFNKEIGKLHDAAAYGAAVLIAEKSTPVEIRLGSPNALQVFLNGKKLFEREEYHHGSNMDYHIAKGELNAGENIIVVKICQNNQKDSWAQSWQFQARVCDATGTPLPAVKQLVAEKKIKLGTVLDAK